MNKESSPFFHLESLAASNVTAVSTFIYNVSARQVQTISVRGIKDILSNAENCLLKRPNAIYYHLVVDTADSRLSEANQYS